MNARDRKVNMGKMLGAFCYFAPNVVPKVLARVVFREFAGNGSGEVSAEAGTSGSYSREFGDAEQERAETLARVNAVRNRWFFTDAEHLILSRQQLRKGIRVWRSGSIRQAVSGWKARAFPLFNRLERVPGAFGSAAAPELLKVRKIPAEARNAAAGFFASMSPAFRNKVRSNSPRWRGTRQHKRARKTSSRTAIRSEWTFGSFISKARATSPVQKILGGLTLARYAASHLELVRAARGNPRTVALVFRAFFDRVQQLAAVSLDALRELLAELRRLRAERDTYAGFIAHINAAAFVLFVAELAERLPPSERVPRPPDLLPLPPSAPLAPPA